MLLNVLLSFIKNKFIAVAYINKIIEIQRLHYKKKLKLFVCFFLLIFLNLICVCLIFFLSKIIFRQKNFCIIFLIFNISNLFSSIL